ATGGGGVLPPDREFVGAVEGADPPRVGRPRRAADGRPRLLGEDPVVRVFLGEAAEDRLLARPVGGGHQVPPPRLLPDPLDAAAPRIASPPASARALTSSSRPGRGRVSRPIATPRLFR